jgi:hypothetical protein
VVKTMELAGFGGNDLIARTLARAGWNLSARTVGRIRKGRGCLRCVLANATVGTGAREGAVVG